MIQYILSFFKPKIDPRIIEEVGKYPYIFSLTCFPPAINKPAPIFRFNIDKSTVDKSGRVSLFTEINYLDASIKDGDKWKPYAKGNFFELRIGKVKPAKFLTVEDL